jgi:ATP-dependent Lhr-like helicase
VDRLVEEITAFLLGGRAWTVEHVNHADRTVRVRPAPWGQKPSWGGFVPRHLSYELCQRMRDILMTHEVRYPYLDPAAQATLDAAREELGPLLASPGPALRFEEGVARWWTFAGGRINHTIKYALEWLEGWKVVADNFLVRIEGRGVKYDDVLGAIARLFEPHFWERADTRAALLSRVPEYRLSKFQRVLPAPFAAEMVGSYLLAFDETAEYLGSVIEVPRR